MKHDVGGKQGRRHCCGVWEMDMINIHCLKVGNFQRIKSITKNKKEKRYPCSPYYCCTVWAGVLSLFISLFWLTSEFSSSYFPSSVSSFSLSSFLSFILLLFFSNFLPLLPSPFIFLSCVCLLAPIHLFSSFCFFSLHPSLSSLHPPFPSLPAFGLRGNKIDQIN